MRFWLLVLIAMIAALGVGISGAPGRAAAAVTAWLDSTGKVELQGPVGEAVKRAL